MNLKLLLTYPFENWLRPVLFALVSFPVFMISSFIDIGLIQLIAGTVFILAFIFLFLSMIFLLFKKEWGKSFYTFVFIVTIVVVFGLFSG